MSLGLDAATPRPELRYELLRAVAWASTHGQIPVSTRTLLDRAVIADAALIREDIFDFTRRRLLRDRLDDLAAVGDLAIVDRGQWISTIGCLVGATPDAPSNHILVSGLPLRHFDTGLRDGISLSGPTRVVTGNANTAEYELPLVSFDDWSRIPRQSLNEWTASVLDGDMDDRDHRSDDAVTQFYLPDRATSGASQDRRWFGADDHLSGRYLARHRILGGWTDYSIAELDCGAPINHHRCDPQDVRRLMYGLDQKHGNPTVATWELSRGIAQLTLQNRLPYAETRALILLADPAQGNHWAVRRNTNEVFHALTNLGINIRTT